MVNRDFLRRAASILLAVSVVLSSFTGFLIFAVGGSGQALIPSNEDIDGAGDWYIGEEYEQSDKYVNGDWSLSGNLTIRSGGVVTIDGGTLAFAQEYKPGESIKTFSLIIEDGGKLVLKNATLTARIDGVAYAFPSLGIMVRSGGVFEAYDSNIIASGHLVVDDSTFNLTRSKILAHTTAAVEDRCDPGYFPTGEFDDSLVILFMSSQVNLFDSRIEGIYEPSDEGTNKSQMYDHDYGFVKDVNSNGNRSAASYVLYRMPSVMVGDASGGVLDDLTMDDLRSYTIGPGSKLLLDGFDIAGMMFPGGSVELTLNVEYTTDPGLSSDVKVNYSYRNGAWAETTKSLAPTPVDPVKGVPLQEKVDIALPSMSSQDLYGLNINIDNLAGEGSVYIDRVWVSIALELETYGNITVAGNTDLTAVNTYLGVDMSRDPRTQNRLVLMDDSKAYLYGVHIDVEETASLPTNECDYPFITIAETFQATASRAGTGDNTNELIGNITSIDDGLYKVESGEVMEIAGFNTSGIRGTIMDVTASVSYFVDSGYAPKNYVQWSTGDGLKNTAIQPTSDTYSIIDRTSNLFDQGLTEMAGIEALSIQFVNGHPTLPIEFDKVWLNITICPTIYIYRWADITVEDRSGHPVSGAGVGASLQSTEKEAHYYTPDGIRNYPSDEVLQYLGKTSDNFNVTGLDGKVRIPYLTEIKNTRAVNITYSASVSYKDELGVMHSKALPITFDTYLYLSEGSTLKQYAVVLDDLLIVLPDLALTPGDIEFTPSNIVAGDTVTAYVRVSNIGLKNANNVLIEAYAGGALLGTAIINVKSSGSEYATLSWKADQVGTYPVDVRINADRAFQEYSFANNQASKNMTVSMVSNGDEWIIDGLSAAPRITMLGSLSPYGNIRVVNGGELVLNGASLKLSQYYDGQFRITVSGGSTIELKNGAILGSTHRLEMIISENSKLNSDSSTISDMVNIIARGHSSLSFENTNIGQGINSPADSDAIVTAVNTTFGNAWTNFGGRATAHLTNVAAPSLSVKDDAAITIYRWLTVTVKDGAGSDGAGSVLPGADVSLSYLSGPGAYVGTTDSHGEVLVEVKCAEMKAGQPVKYTGGGYSVNTTYWYDGKAYEGDDVISVTLDNYTAPLYQTSDSVGLDISSAKPDLDPLIYFSNDEPARGQVVTISTEVVNNGPVDAHNVRVLFRDNTTDTVLYSGLIPVVPKGGQVTVSADWTATYPLGEHKLSISVDPYREIVEGDETNNNATRQIAVRGIADLMVGPGDITFDTTSSVRERGTTISVRVTNQGDVKADNVNVSVYTFDSLGQPRLIGTQFINSLINGTSASISLSWTPALAGSHTIQVIVDGDRKIEDINRGNNNATVVRSVLDFPDLEITTIDFSPSSPVAVNDEVTVTAKVINNGGTAVSNVMVNFYLNEVSPKTMFYQANIPYIQAGGSERARGYMTAELARGIMEDVKNVIIVVNPDQTIKETNFDNNQAIQPITVKEDRPDIMFIDEFVRVTRDGNPVNNASVGEIVVISATVRNNGNVPAIGMLFVFYAVDDLGRITQIDTAVKDIDANKEIDLIATWTVNVTIGDYDILIIANYDQMVEEYDNTNNQMGVKFEAVAPNTKIEINDLSGIAYEPGQDIYVSGKVTNRNTTLGVSHAKVEVWLEKDGVPVGEKVSGITANDGTFRIALYLKQGLEGDFVVNAAVTMGDNEESTSRLIQVKAAPEGGIPWFVYLLIFALVSAVIVIFSAYLYKYGLGRMVECGECAALIPEASKRCPKCGVQFEPGTAKCSECNAWIPSNSTQCPECGTKFITEAIEEEEDAHIKKMRGQYESYVETYREEAKLEMGRKYTDARFPAWWKKHPAFISFEQWLSQEEEKLKSSGSLCPVCATHNPRGSPICQKCGSTLELPKAPAEPAKKEEPPRKPMRRIVRRPVSKTEAPAEPKAVEGGVKPEKDAGSKEASEKPKP